MTRRHYSSVAADTTLTSGIDSSATSFVTPSLTGWPAVPFTAILDPGTTSSEELVLVTAVSGDSVTDCTRGYDGTPAVSHSAGAVVRHGVGGIDYDQANAHVNGSSGVHGVTGAVVGTTDTQMLSGKTLTTPTIASFVNATHDHSSAAQGGTLAIATAWTDYSSSIEWGPANTGLFNGTLTARYKQIGKTVHLAIRLVAGSSTDFGSGNFSFSLPNGLPAVNGGVNFLLAAQGFDSSAGAAYNGVALLPANSATITRIRLTPGSGTAVNATFSAPFTWASGDELDVSGTYETA